MKVRRISQRQLAESVQNNVKHYLAMGATRDDFLHWLVTTHGEHIQMLNMGLEYMEQEVKNYEKYEEIMQILGK